MVIVKNNLWTLVTSTFLGIVASILATFIFPFLREYLPIFVVMIIALTGMVLLLDSMINKVNEEQTKLEKKTESIVSTVEERIKRMEEFIDIKAENKYLKDKILRIEEMIKSGS